MEVINLTPHALKIVRDGKAVLEIPSVGVARARQADKVVGELQLEEVTVPVVETQFGETEGLPEPREGVAYVVSIITANAARSQGRTTSDLLITSGLERDAEGVIIGCRAFARVV